MMPLVLGLCCPLSRFLTVGVLLAVELAITPSVRLNARDLNGEGLAGLNVLIDSLIDY